MLSRIAVFAFAAFAGCSSGGSAPAQTPGGDGGPSGGTSTPFAGTWLRTFKLGPVDRVHALGGDASGNTYLLGQFTGTIDLGDGPITSSGSYPNPVLAKVDSAGALVWKKHLTFNGAEAETLAVAADGAVAMGGFVRGDGDLFGTMVDTIGSIQRFVVVFEASGEVRFVQLLASQYGSIQFGDLAFAADGRLAVAGALGGSATIAGSNYTGDDKGDAALFIFGRDGKPIITKVWPVAGAQKLSRVAFGPSQTVSFLAPSGVDYGGGVTTEQSLVTLGADGEFVHSMAVTFGTDTGLSIGADGTVALAGSPNATDVTVYKPTHEKLFTQSITSRSTARVLGVAVGNGAYTIAGSGLNESSIAGMKLATNGLYGFVVELDSTGKPLRNLVIKSEMTLQAEGVRYDAMGSLLIEGRFQTMTMPLGLTPVGPSDGGRFLLKMK